MNERDRIVRICRDLNLPASQYVIAGSGSMIMHGITHDDRGKPMGDLDVLCATALWFGLFTGNRSVMSEGARPVWDSPASYVPIKVHWKLFLTDPDDPATRVDPPYLYADMYGLEVNIFHGWRRRSVGDIDVGNWIANSGLINQVPCVPLQFIFDWKDQMGRAKDAIDIELLKARLK